MGIKKVQGDYIPTWWKTEGKLVAMVLLAKLVHAEEYGTSHGSIRTFIKIGTIGIIGISIIHISVVIKTEIASIYLVF